MGIKKIIFYIATSIILSGCVQSTAMVGPAITMASTGNFSQAGITFLTNKAVEEETGLNTVEFVSKKLEENNTKYKMKRDFKKLVETNIEKTRQKLILQDQSKLLN